MDALSEALGSVRLTGAIFYDAICTAPWGFAVPRMQDVAHVLAPGTECLVGYHLVAEGQAVVAFEGGPAIALTAGDVVIVPHGDPHVVSRGRPATLTDSGASVRSNLAGDLATYRIGGGGEVTRFICGYFGCERHAARLFLAGLPRVVTVNLRNDVGPGAWLESSILHLLSEAASGRPGRAALLSRMAEGLVIETLRRHMETMPPEQTGWLAGARDPVVGGALALTRFYAQVLDALGAPLGNIQKSDRRNAITLSLMQACKVRLLVMDELHNLLCGPSSRQREMLGLIRYLGNELRIPLVALGTKEAWLALRLDNQLENRFQPFVLPRWADDFETGRLLASFEAVIPLREPSGLGLPALRRLIVERSEGLIGEMHQLLTSAATHALMEGRERIEEGDLTGCFFQAPSLRRQMMERELRA